MTRRTETLLLVGLLGPLLACGGRQIKVIPDPNESEVFVDDQQVGVGVTEVEIKKETSKYQLRVCGPVGYFCRSMVIGHDSPDTLQVTPPKDHSYFDTVDGVDNVNKWIKIPVASQYSTEEAWQKLMSSLTTAIADFEVLDQKSLYAKSAWKVAGRRGDQLRTRSRIVIAVDNPDPKSLTFKWQIESERINDKNEKVEAISRTYRQFLDALETSRSRLAH